MSMFRRDPTSEAPAEPKGGAARAERTDALTTHVASGSRLVGELSGSAEVVIDGEVEGTVRSESRVTIGPEGRVQGAIEARRVRIAGQHRGPVTGHERVELASSARLEGDIAAPRVVIAEGAFFKGKVEMTGQAPAAGRAAAPNSTAAKPGSPPRTPPESPERKP